jgi:hypothetical protein
MPPELQPFLTTLIYALIGLILAFATWVLKQLRILVEAKIANVQANTDATLWNAIVAAVPGFVKAVEQMSVVEGWAKEGSLKLDAALQLLSDFAKNLGVDLPADRARSLIESAIHDGWEKPSGPASFAPPVTPKTPEEPEKANG